jgi:hypothetical protein
MYAHITEEMQFFPHTPSPISGFVRCAKLKLGSELRSQETTFYLAAVIGEHTASVAEGPVLLLEEETYS